MAYMKYSLILLSLIMPIVSGTAYNTGYVFTHSYLNSSVSETFDCNFATYSIMENTSLMPIINFGLGCNQSILDTLYTMTADVGEFIALIGRGDCLFSEKSIYAVKLGARGVIIYNYIDSDSNFVMGSSKPYTSPIPVVSISGVDGYWIIRHLQDTEDQILGQILIAHYRTNGNTLAEVAFIVFVTLVFIVLIIVLIALVLTIYQLCCRCFTMFREKRRSEASQREMRDRLNEITCKPYCVPTDTTSNDGIHDSCAVCLEEYKSGDIIRILPCSHPFHKECVDPWLLNKYTCPLCKYNVLTKKHADVESIGATNDNNETTAAQMESNTEGGINRSNDDHSDSISLISNSSEDRLLIV